MKTLVRFAALAVVVTAVVFAALSKDVVAAEKKAEPKKTETKKAEPPKSDKKNDAKKPDVAAKPDPKPEISTATFSYKVAKGDTLFALAKKFNVSAEAIQKANNFKDPKELKEGKSIVIPGKGPQAPAPATTDKAEAKKTPEPPAKPETAKEKAAREKAEKAEREAAARRVPTGPSAAGASSADAVKDPYIDLPVFGRKELPREMQFAAGEKLPPAKAETEAPTAAAPKTEAPKQTAAKAAEAKPADAGSGSYPGVSGPQQSLGPGGERALDLFKKFSGEWIDKVNRTYPKEVQRVGDKFVYRFTAADKDSMVFRVKPSSYDHTPFVGVMRYAEKAFEAEGPTEAAAKSAPPKVVRETNVTEIFRYDKSKWVY